MAQGYEEQMNLIRGELGPGSTDLEEFEGLVPNFASDAQLIYVWILLLMFMLLMMLKVTTTVMFEKIILSSFSWRSACIPPTPADQIDIEIDSRFTL